MRALLAALLLLASVPATASAETGATPFTQVYDPSAGEDRSWYLNDHTFIQDEAGTWHLFGITGTDPAHDEDEDAFAHATAPHPRGPWTKQPPALRTDPAYGETHLWAPHVIRHGSTYYMFYAGGGPDPTRHAINLATSTDLRTWTRLPSGPLFRDGAVARDPHVVRIGDRWVMYYTATSEPTGGNHVVAYRTSTDLVRWSERAIAFTDPATGFGAGTTESPFVLFADGAWRLLIGPRGGYVGTDVFTSADPFRFDTGQLTGHVYAHAAEVVPDGDGLLVSHAGWGQRGVWLADLRVTGGSHQYAPEATSSPASGIAVVSGVDGRQEVFVGAADQVWGRYQLTRGGGWSAWYPFGGPRSAALSAVRDLDGRLEVFASGEGRVDRRAQTAPNVWGGWEPFGTAAHAMTAARNADGRLELFASGPVGIYHRWQTSPGGAWADWRPFGGPADSVLATGRDARGRLAVFAAADGAVHRRAQSAPSGGWLPFEAFGAVPGVRDLEVAPHPHGGLSLFAAGSSGVHRRSQSAPAGAWSGWTPFGGPGSAELHSARNADGRLELFAATSAVTAHRWEDGAGGWAAWDRFGPGASAVGAGTNADGRLEVFAASRSGPVGGRYQLVPSGGWSAWAWS